MGKKIKKIFGMILAIAVLLGGLPVYESSAAVDRDYDIVYIIPGKGRFETQSLAEAFLAAHKNSKVEIIVLADREADFPPYIEYGYIKEDTILLVEGGATLTINKYNLRMDGLLMIRGTVDIEHSEGFMYGSGNIRFLDDGKLLKRPYTIDKRGETSLEAKDIRYGQTLADATITTDKVNWLSSIEGTWHFCDEEYAPQAGSRCHDVFFLPKYPFSYETKVFEKSGKVTTKQAVPQLEKYVKPQIHAGENLLGVQPQMTFVSPVTGETVEGDFSFEKSNELLYSIGEQEILGTFQPRDSNYAAVTQYFKVDVLGTEPAIMEMPVIRNQGIYGQTLQDIQYLQGKCTNPHTGKVIKGSWEWSNPNERLCLGEQKYSMLFVPEEDGYKRLEIDMTVNTCPKVMENLTWPSCSDIIYGQSLSESKLSFTKNEYGTFAWKNENIRPGVKNQGAEVVFIPAATDTYDWSRIAGYDENTKTITFTIPVQVHSIKGELPSLRAEAVQEGTCVSGSALSLEGQGGTLEWKNPEQIVEEPGRYEVYYTPEDRDNYDWSDFQPEEDGKIKMSVYLQVIPKPIIPTPIPIPTDTPTEKPTDTPTDKPTDKPTDTPTDKPTDTPTDKPTDTPTDVPTPTPDGDFSHGQDDFTNPDDKKGKEDGDKETEHAGNQQAAESQTSPHADSSYVITQLVSRMSTITGSNQIKRTKIKKVRRIGKKVRVSWKKISGAGGYSLQYGRSKKMKKAKKINVVKTSVSLSGLKRGKSYYIRVRAWKKQKGRKVYGKWSKIKTIS